VRSEQINERGFLLVEPMICNVVERFGALRTVMVRIKERLLDLSPGIMQVVLLPCDGVQALVDFFSPPSETHATLEFFQSHGVILKHVPRSCKIETGSCITWLFSCFLKENLKDCPLAFAAASVICHLEFHVHSWHAVSRSTVALRTSEILVDTTNIAPTFVRT
jgi:hypothetical protein